MMIVCVGEQIVRRWIGTDQTMNAATFNAQIEEALGGLLRSAGFSAAGRDYVREERDSQLVLLRFGGSKFANACQFVRFVLGFRHTFLRDVWEKVPEGLPGQMADYPFRIRPSELASEECRQWRYEFELNTRYDEVDYGRLDDATRLLTRMGQAITTNGIEWSRQFTPARSLEILQRQPQPAFVERLWIEDYRARLAENAGGPA
jgi:hypothetical protein